MSNVKTLEDVKEFLPYGALLVRDNEPVVELVFLEVKESTRGTPVLLGWAYPNKDFTFELDNVSHQKGGWLVFSRGRRAVLRPLTEERGRIVAEAVDSV